MLPLENSRLQGRRTELSTRKQHEKKIGELSTLRHVFRLKHAQKTGQLGLAKRCLPQQRGDKDAKPALNDARNGCRQAK